MAGVVFHHQSCTIMEHHFNITELLAKIQTRAQHVSTTSTGPCHVRMQLRSTSTMYTKTCFFNWFVTRAQNKHVYTSTAPYHTYKYVRRTRCFLVEYFELVCSRIRILLYRPKRYMPTYVTANNPCFNPVCLISIVQ